MLKILDFGLARAFQTPDDKSAHAITNFYLPHSAFTPAYASCEIIENMPPTPKDDVYALGCIAHELLTKKHPYDRVFANIAKKENLTVKQNKHLTPIEHRAISRAVELDKNKRTESANEFLRDIVGVTSSSFWSGYSIKTLIIAAVTLVTIVGIYTVYKLITYETINAKQAIIVNQYEIEKNLEKAEYYMQSNRDHIQGENSALILYQDVLKIDPDNVRAKSGIENINKQLASNQVSNLLDKARKEEALKHYVRPENENAYNTYLEVLKLNQNQAQALHGIDRIRNAILNEAEILMQKNKLDKAELHIKDALMIYPGNLDAVKLYSKLKAKRLSDNDQQIKDKNITEPSDIINYPSNEERIDDFIQQIPEERLSASERRLIKLHGMKAEYFVNKGINYSADNKNSTFYFKRILEIDSRNEYAKKGIDNAWLSLIENINHEFEVNDSLVAIEKLEKLKDLFLPYYDVKTLISALSSKKAKRLSGSDRRRSIAFHLTKAKIHLEADRLTLPKGNNAVESYLEVLNLDLHNNEARSGLKTIESILSERIRKEIDQKQYSKANDELKQALEVFPESKILNDIKRIIVDSQKNSHQGLDIKKQISDLTDKALNALDKRRYIFPIGRSAYDYYSNINSIKPNDSVGIRGLNIAKLRAYDQIYSDIANNNYQIAYLRIDRLSKLGITDKRLSELRAKLIEADRSYKDATLDLTQYGNYLLYLLMYAKQKEAEGVIWPPLSNNAFNIYSHVHDIEPLNNAAKQALARLFKNRIMNIKELLDNRRLNEAESELLLLDNHYNGKSEKKLLSSMRNELNTLKNINIQF